MKQMNINIQTKHESLDEYRNKEEAVYFSKRFSAGRRVSER